MRVTLQRFALLVLVASSGRVAFAQAGLPTSQPSLISIVREEVKTGRNADHARIEAGWPAAYAKAKSPDYYLAFTSLTGPNEAWYVTPYASHAAMGDGMKRDAADPVLSAELARLQRADAEAINSVRTIHASARPDLSVGVFPDLASMRFWEIQTFRVRPGHEAQFEAAAKTYVAVAKRTTPNTRFRAYEVLAGLPGPTYLLFSSAASFGEMDQWTADNAKAFAAMTPDDAATMQKFAAEALINSESQRFQLDPVMSYVSKETRATDPGFWMKKPPARVASQP